MGSPSSGGQRVTGSGAGGDPAGPAVTRWRRWAGVAVLVLVAAAVAATVVGNWGAFVDSIDRVGAGGLLASGAFGLVGVAATGLQWRAVLRGLQVPLGVRDAAQVFFLSQLGKYLPGSVWPVVMQMEAGRTRNANRRTMVAANLITVVLSLATGVVLAGLLLPFSSPGALRRFWWALASLPLLVVLAHPSSLPFALDRVLKAMHRAPLGVRMTPAATAAAVGWSALSWIGLGLQLTVLCSYVGRPSVGLVALCIGGMSLAVSAGVLFIPAPAGAGIREVVLGFVLVTVLSSGQVIAVVVASRVLLIAVDVLLAAVAVLGGARRPAAAGTGSGAGSGTG